MKPVRSDGMPDPAYVDTPEARGPAFEDSIFRNITAAQTDNSLMRPVNGDQHRGDPGAVGADKNAELREGIITRAVSDGSLAKALSEVKKHVDANSFLTKSEHEGPRWNPRNPWLR